MGMTIDEMIAIVKAYNDGKAVEMRLNRENNAQYPGEWSEVDNPAWDFERYEFRIKQRYIPYANAEEFLQAQRWQSQQLTGNVHVVKKDSPFRIPCSAAVTFDGRVFIKNVPAYSEAHDTVTLDDLLKKYTWYDKERTPCGKLVKQ